MKPYLRLLLSLALAGMVVSPARAEDQNHAGDAAAGHRLATGWCSNCHGGDPRASEPAMGAPSFAEIANQRSTTAYRLRTFLRSSHTTMPNFVIKPAEIDDLVAYILSLRRTRR